MTRALYVLIVLLAAGFASAQSLDGPWLAVASGEIDVEGGVMRLAARREGLIAEVMVKEGARVEKGQALARIDDTKARLELGSAQDSLEQAKVEVELADLRLTQARTEVNRLRPLPAANAIPAQKLVEAINTLNIATLEVRKAKIEESLAKRIVAQREAEIEAHLVRSPQTGTILRSSARVGDGTTTNTVTEMFLFVPDGPRVVRADLDEQFVGFVEPGQRAQIVSEQGAGATLEGEVLRVAGIYGTPWKEAGNGTRTVEIVVLINSPPDVANDLILGQRMIVRILR